MRIFTPASLRYPITVTKLLRAPGDDVDQGTALFRYQYQATVTESSEENPEGKEVLRSWYADFESELEGKVTSLDIKADQVITRRTAVAEIEEPCTHEIQYGGLCALCEKDMTTVSYNTTQKNTSRATINTTHGNTALLVSGQEASKADEEAKRRLLDSRKLSLVVDLDQTIIHATVDPTVEQWQKDPSNPNHEAVKDVRAFQLSDEGSASRQCWYYIKLRPGLEDFLRTMSEYYELHIYTMGTRAYAENIARLIDPDRKIFSDRILSRDESGSMTAKNLKRLFPVDTRMVVIIDDRGDVWQWSPNLIKVSAYDFFVGIGDINSSFLPKRPELEAAKPKPTKVPSPVVSEGSSEESEKDSTVQSNPPSVPSTAPSTPPPVNGDASAVDRLVTMAGSQDAGAMKEKANQQDETLSSQLEDRPLLQKQKILDAAEDEAKTSPAAEAAANLLSPDENQDSTAPPTEHASKYRHNLLQDDDTELHHLSQSLRNIHSAFFTEYDRSNSTTNPRVTALNPKVSAQKPSPSTSLSNIPDAAALMATMKRRVLAGVHLVFTGVVPLGVNIHHHDTAIWAKSFGASVSENVDKKTTHVIASPQRRTVKVRQALRKGPGRIAVVSQGWLFACFSQWKRVSEAEFRIHSEGGVNGGAGLPGGFAEGAARGENALSSSDSEATGTEDESAGEESGTSSALAVRTEELETDTEAELEKYKPSSDRDESPIEEHKEDWEDIDREFKDFMGEDYDSDDSEFSMASLDSGREGSENGDGGGGAEGERKRKREDGEVGGESAGDEEHRPGESRLQKRKKEALERTTSLTKMATVPASSPANGSSPAAAVNEPDGSADSETVKADRETVEDDSDPEAAGDGGEDVVEDDDEDDLGTMLEAEMSRSDGDEEGF
ncbi:hypothetical protein MBLNU230_g7143t1 [Neophaeotheca triangularis]